jgi:hypothetical protein
MINTADINNFWRWFKTNSDSLQSDKYPNDLFTELDKRLYDIGLYWEAGPGVKKENLLTISVSGRRELLDKAKELVANAPVIDDWEFDVLKKPKTNWDILEIPNDNIKISAINWTYTLLKYKDGKREILIKGESLSDFEKDKRIELAEIVLTNLLGEERMMNELDYLDVLELHDTTFDTRDIKGLTQQLEYIKNGA